MESNDSDAIPRHKLSSSAQPFIPSFLRDHQPVVPETNDGGPHPPPPSVAAPSDHVAETMGHTAQATTEQTEHPVRGSGEAPYRGRGAHSQRRQRGRQHQRRGKGGSPSAADQARAMLTVNAFSALLSSMPEDDVDALMECLPADVQQLYETHLTHHSRMQQGGRQSSSTQQSRHHPQQRGPRSRGPSQQQQQSPIIAAALATFVDLNSDQLLVLEDALWQLTEEDVITEYRATELTNSGGSGGAGAHEMYEGMEGANGQGIFLLADDGLNADEEAWFLEQMMLTDAAAKEEASKTKKK